MTGRVNLPVYCHCVIKWSMSNQPERPSQAAVSNFTIIAPNCPFCFLANVLEKLQTAYDRMQCCFMWGFMWGCLQVTEAGGPCLLTLQSRGLPVQTSLA